MDPPVPIDRVQRWSDGFHLLVNDEMGRKLFKSFMEDEGTDSDAACNKFWLAWVGLKAQAKTDSFNPREAYSFAELCMKEMFKKKRKQPVSNSETRRKICLADMGLPDHVMIELRDKWSSYSCREDKSLDKNEILDLFHNSFYHVEQRLAEHPFRNYLQSDRYLKLLNPALADDDDDEYVNQDQQDEGQETAADPVNESNNNNNSDDVNEQDAGPNAGSDHVWEMDNQMNQLNLKDDNETDNSGSRNKNNNNNNNHVQSNETRTRHSNYTHESIPDASVIERNSRAANSVFLHAPVDERMKTSNSANFIMNINGNMSNRLINVNNNNDPNFTTRVNFDLMTGTEPGSLPKAQARKGQTGGKMASLTENVVVSSNNNFRPVPQQRGSSLMPSSSSSSLPHYPTLNKKQQVQQQQQHHSQQQSMLSNILLPSTSTAIPPNPYHTSYNPKLPPSANDSEITSRVSGASLSDVDYKMKAHQPIDAKEMRRQKHKSLVNSNANSNAHVSATMFNLSKSVPQPIRAGVASSSGRQAPSSEFGDDHYDLRTVSSERPHIFADLIGKKLQDLLSRQTKTKYVIRETFEEVTSLLAKKNREDMTEMQPEDCESILEDHIGTLPTWKTGITPDRSGRQSPSVNRARGFAAAAAATGLSGSSRRMQNNAMTMPSGSSSRSHHPSHLYHYNVRDWVNDGGGHASAAAASAGMSNPSRSKSHSIKSNSSSRSKNSRTGAAAVSGLSGNPSPGNSILPAINCQTSSASSSAVPAPTSVISVSVSYHFNDDPHHPGAPGIEVYRFMYTEGCEMSLRTFKNSLENLPTTPRIRNASSNGFSYFLAEMEHGNRIWAQVMDDSQILPFISEKQIEARVHVH